MSLLSDENLTYLTGKQIFSLFSDTVKDIKVGKNSYFPKQNPLCHCY